MAIPCDVSSECGDLACIEHRCVRAEDVEREREAARIAARDPVRRRYVGATVAAFASYGFEGRNVQALGGDAFVGLRLRRWFSLEGFYTYDFALNRSPEPPVGAMCVDGVARTWIGDWFRWQTLGVRAWFHLVHLRAFDFSAASLTSAGFELDHTSFCKQGNRVTKGPAVELGTAFAIELRPTAWLGFRLSVEALLDFGLGVGALRGSLGPVVRF